MSQAQQRLHAAEIVVVTALLLFYLGVTWEMRYAFGELQALAAQAQGGYAVSPWLLAAGLLLPAAVGLVLSVWASRRMEDREVYTARTELAAARAAEAAARERALEAARDLAHVDQTARSCARPFIQRALTEAPLPGLDGLAAEEALYRFFTDADAPAGSAPAGGAPGTPAAGAGAANGVAGLPAVHPATRP